MRGVQSPGTVSDYDQLMADVVTLSVAELTAITKDLRTIDLIAEDQGEILRLTRHIREVLADGLGPFTRGERRYISERTREALAERKAQGVKLGGSSPTLPGWVVVMIQELRNSGMTIRAIADRLNSEGVPTAKGTGEWKPGTVNYVLKRYAG